MGASLKDIACKLNLSKTTVSWVLSGQGDKKGISAETQSRVLACARSLAYEPNLLARTTDQFLDRHEELTDWADLHSPQELQAAYPNVGYGTASTLAKIATDPELSKEFDQSLTADAIERMRAVPLPEHPEHQSNVNLPMPDSGIGPAASANPMGSGLGM